jgi:hypothetical protein
VGLAFLQECHLFRLGDFTQLVQHLDLAYSPRSNLPVSDYRFRLALNNHYKSDGKQECPPVPDDRAYPQAGNPDPVDHDGCNCRSSDGARNSTTPEFQAGWRNIPVLADSATELRREESEWVREDLRHREIGDNSCRVLHWHPVRSRWRWRKVDDMRKTDCDPERVDTLDDWRFHNADHPHRYTVIAFEHERFREMRWRNLPAVRIVPALGQATGLHCQTKPRELQEEAIRDTKMSRQVGSASRSKSKAYQEVVMNLWRTVACYR